MNTCKDCCWWMSVGEDDHGLCYGVAPSVGNYRSFPITEAGARCPRLKLRYDDYIFQPEHCDGCKAAEQVINQMLRFFSGEHWWASGIVEQEGPNMRRASLERVYQRFRKLRDSLLYDGKDQSGD